MCATCNSGLPWECFAHWNLNVNDGMFSTGSILAVFHHHVEIQTNSRNVVMIILFLLLVIALEDVWWIGELFFYTNFSSNNACKNPVVFVKFPNSGSVSGAIFCMGLKRGKHRRFRKGCHISPQKIRVMISICWVSGFLKVLIGPFFFLYGWIPSSNLVFLLTGGVWKGEELLALEDRTVDRWRNLDITPNLERCRKRFLVDLKVIEGGGGVNTLLGGGRLLSIMVAGFSISMEDQRFGGVTFAKESFCLLEGAAPPHPKKTRFIAHDEIANFPSHTCYMIW